MEIKKIKHCCMQVDVGGVRIVFDPAMWIGSDNVINDIDLFIFTHEHPDHLDLESLEILVKENQNVEFITNSSVSKILINAGIKNKIQIVEDGQSAEFKNVKIEAYGSTHKEIYGEFGLVQNTGYFINDKFFFPGDQYTNPNREIDLLAVCYIGPFAKVSETVDYIKEVKPKKVFGVHDGLASDFGKEVYYFIETSLTKDCTDFVRIDDGESLTV